MTHTALSLYRSPNPTQLEARIVAHHATDTRFAFLRAARTAPNGNLAKAWEKAKYDAKVELGIIKLPLPGSGLGGSGMGLGGLGGYASSDEDEDEGDDEGAMVGYK